MLIAKIRKHIIIFSKKIIIIPVSRLTGTDRNGPRRTGTDQNGPERTEADLVCTETDLTYQQFACLHDRNGPKRTLCIPKRTKLIVCTTETDRNEPERTETDLVCTETDLTYQQFASFLRRKRTETGRYSASKNHCISHRHDEWKILFEESEHGKNHLKSRFKSIFSLRCKTKPENNEIMAHKYEDKI